MVQLVWYKRPGVDGDRYLPQILDINLPEDYNRDVYVAVHDLKPGEVGLSYEELEKLYPSPPQPEPLELPKVEKTETKDDGMPEDRFAPFRTV